MSQYWIKPFIFTDLSSYDVFPQLCVVLWCVVRDSGHGHIDLGPATLDLGNTYTVTPHLTTQYNTHACYMFQCDLMFIQGVSQINLISRDSLFWYRIILANPVVKTIISSRTIKIKWDNVLLTESRFIQQYYLSFIPFPKNWLDHIGPMAHMSELNSSFSSIPPSFILELFSLLLQSWFVNHIQNTLLLAWGWTCKITKNYS